MVGFEMLSAGVASVGGWDPIWVISCSLKMVTAKHIKISKNQNLILFYIYCTILSLGLTFVVKEPILVDQQV